MFGCFIIVPFSQYPSSFFSCFGSEFISPLVSSSFFSAFSISYFILFDYNRSMADAIYENIAFWLFLDIYYLVSNFACEYVDVFVDVKLIAHFLNVCIAFFRIRLLMMMMKMRAKLGFSGIWLNAYRPNILLRFYFRFRFYFVRYPFQYY